MVSLALDGSVHLAPFASTGTFDAQTRLTTPTDMLLAAAAKSSGLKPTAVTFPLPSQMMPCITNSLALSPDGQLIFTAVPPSSRDSSGGVLVYRLHAPLPALRMAPKPPVRMGRNFGSIDDPDEAVTQALAADGAEDLKLVPIGAASGYKPKPLFSPSQTAPNQPAIPLPVPAIGGCGGDVVCPLGGVVMVYPHTPTPIYGYSATRLYTGHTANVSSITIHPSGGVVASGQPGAVKIWSLTSMQTLAVLGARAASSSTETKGISAPTTLVFSQDGESLLSLVPHADPEQLAEDERREAAAAAREAEAEEAAEAEADKNEKELLNLAAKVLNLPKDYDPADELPTRKDKKKKKVKPAKLDEAAAKKASLYPSPAIVAVWGWRGGLGARRLPPDGVIHVPQPLAQARAHGLPALCASFLPEDNAVNGTDAGSESIRLITAGVGHARFWALDRHSKTLRVEAEPEMVGISGGSVLLCCCATPSGCFFGTDDGFLLHFASQTANLLRRLSAHHGPLTSLYTLGPLDKAPGASSAIASAGADGRIRLWSEGAEACATLKTGAPVGALRDAYGRLLQKEEVEGVRGLSWAGARGAVAQCGRATFGIAPESGTADLVVLSTPPASDRDALAQHVRHGWERPLPSCELTTNAQNQTAFKAERARLMPGGWGPVGTDVDAWGEPVSPPTVVSPTEPQGHAIASVKVKGWGASADGWTSDEVLRENCPSRMRGEDTVAPEPNDLLELGTKTLRRPTPTVKIIGGPGGVWQGPSMERQHPGGPGDRVIRSECLTWR